MVCGTRSRVSGVPCYWSARSKAELLLLLPGHIPGKSNCDCRRLESPSSPQPAGGRWGSGRRPPAPHPPCSMTLCTRLGLAVIQVGLLLSIKLIPGLQLFIIMLTSVIVLSFINIEWFSLELLFFFLLILPVSLVEKQGQGQKYQIMDFNKLSICIYTYIHMCWATCCCYFFLLKFFGGCMVQWWFFTAFLRATQTTDSYKICTF